MTTSQITGDDPSVPPVMDRGTTTGGQTWCFVDARGSALANLAASEALPWDHPAQVTLLARAQAYATVAIAERA